MSRVEEIEKAIETLSPDEFSQIARWVVERVKNAGRLRWTATPRQEHSISCAKKPTA